MRACVLLLLLLPGIGLTQTTGKASGIPEALKGQPPAAQRVEIEIAQGVAFPGDYSDYEYVLLPAGVSVAGIEQAIDPQAVLKARADVQDVPYVFGSVRSEGGSASASFTRKGQYGGYLGSGYLHGARIEQGRLRGRLALQQDDTGNALEATLDAPIMPRAAGTPLPADGGAVWREFERLRDALRSGKEAAIRARLGATIVQQFPPNEPFGKILPQLVKSFPMKARLVSGASTAVDARLVLLDDSSGKPVRCIITLLPEGDEWRMHRMSFRHGDDPIDSPAPPTAFTDVPPEGG
jgi:hypothetical protein